MEDDTALAVMRRNSLHRTPEQYHAAYEQYQRAIEPLVKAAVEIRKLAQPRVHLRELPDGSLQLEIDHDCNLDPKLRAQLTWIYDQMREMAGYYGFSIDT